MPTFLLTSLKLPFKNHERRVFAAEREVCPDLVEVFAFSLFLFTRLDLRVDLMRMNFRSFRILARISFEFTMRSEKRTPRTICRKHLKLSWIIF
jgi:hypothetical protein